VGPKSRIYVRLYFPLINLRPMPKSVLQCFPLCVAVYSHFTLRHGRGLTSYMDESAIKRDIPQYTDYEEMGHTLELNIKMKYEKYCQTVFRINGLVWGGFD